MAKRKGEEVTSAAEGQTEVAVSEDKAGNVAVKKAPVDPAVKERKDKIKHLYGRVKYMLYMDTQLMEKSLVKPGWALSIADVSVGRASDSDLIALTVGDEETQNLTRDDVAEFFLTQING